MKKAVFNLSKLQKQAYYEDAKGQFQTMSRTWGNCWKIKVDGGMQPQEAINSCIEEYQTLAGGKWATKYAGTK